MRNGASDFPGLTWASFSARLFGSQNGDQWLDAMTEVLLIVPSVIMPWSNAPERNILINHQHPDAASFKIVRVDLLVSTLIEWGS